MAELHQEVGATITKWANLEFSLLECFAKSVGLNLQQTGVLLAHVINFTTKLSMVDTVMKFHLLPANLPHWNSLVEYIRELAGDRNALAHQPLIGRVDGDPNTVPPDQIEWVIGPPIRDFVMGEKSDDYITTDEVRELGEDIQQAISALRAFTSALDSLQSLQPIFCQPVVRRRPPRNVRREANRKARRRPPAT